MENMRDSNSSALKRISSRLVSSRSFGLDPLFVLDGVALVLVSVSVVEEDAAADWPGLLWQWAEGAWLVEGY